MYESNSSFEAYTSSQTIGLKNTSVVAAIQTIQLAVRTVLFTDLHAYSSRVVDPLPRNGARIWSGARIIVRCTKAVVLLNRVTSTTCGRCRQAPPRHVACCFDPA
jgi:hypothetical protein